MGEKRKKIALRVKPSVKQGQRLRVEIGYIPTSNADWRLRRAVDILLRSAVREMEGRIGTKKEAEPHQGSPLTEATETKDESQSSGEKARTPKGDT